MEINCTNYNNIYKKRNEKRNTKLLKRNTL